MAASFTCDFLTCRTLHWVAICAFLLFSHHAGAEGNEAGRGCREAFSDHINTVRACNVVLASPSLPIPEVIRALQIRAQALLGTGKPELAITDYTRAISYLPKGQLQGYIFYLRGKTYLEFLSITAENLKLATRDLEQANWQAPYNSRILEALTTAYMKQQRPEDAIRTATEALRADERSVIARKLRAHAQEQIGKARFALDDLDVLLVNTPHDHELLIWRGRIHQNRNNIHAALADFRKAARILTTDDILKRIRQLEAVLQN